MFRTTCRIWSRRFVGTQMGLPSTSAASIAAAVGESAQWRKVRDPAETEGAREFLYCEASGAVALADGAAKAGEDCTSAAQHPHYFRQEVDGYGAVDEAELRRQKQRRRAERAGQAAAGGPSGGGGVGKRKQGRRGRAKRQHSQRGG